MTAPLTKKHLLALILNAIDDGGWRALVASATHPFHLRVFRNDDGDRGFNLRIYIWNCTHGGGSARAADEYRIQLTGVVPTIHPGEVTLLLGWHDGYGVFAAWDIAKHSGQDSKSPSAQIKEDALANAHTHAFSIHRRHNGEIAIAFRPEFLVEYALSAESMHRSGKAVEDIAVLNSLDSITDAQIGAVANTQRRIIISQIARKYRAHDFKQRVLGAYGNRCAVCGVQLKLIDAAHIIPVADPSSTDETANGIALCKIHHAAMDRNLISVNENYRIEVSSTEINKLEKDGLHGGIKVFRQHLKTAILLPADRRDYPKPTYFKRARVVRNWTT